MNQKDQIKAVYKQALEMALDDLRSEGMDLFEDAISLCESPIEQRLMAALLWIRPVILHFAGNRFSLALQGMTVTPQKSIPPYRVDIFIEVTPPYQAAKPFGFVIECDGHAFHEKTKEQAAADKARDRYFAGLGYRVFRFTGSEIHKDAIGCAEQVRLAICDELWRIQSMLDRQHKITSQSMKPEGTPA